jgi:putative membrane protein
MRDQQIGGLLLWIPGSMMSVIGALVALRHWMRLSARGRVRGERRAMAASPAKADVANTASSTVGIHR